MIWIFTQKIKIKTMLEIKLIIKTNAAEFWNSWSATGFSSTKNSTKPLTTQISKYFFFVILNKVQKLTCRRRFWFYLTLHLKICTFYCCTVDKYELRHYILPMVALCHSKLLQIAKRKLLAVDLGAFNTLDTIIRYNFQIFFSALFISFVFLLEKQFFNL